MERACVVGGQKGHNGMCLPESMLFATWLLFLEEVDVISPSLKSGLDLGFAWPTECGRSDRVQVLSLHLMRPCLHETMLPALLRPLLLLCE